MPNADYFALGQWNAICDRCGRKFKSSRLRPTWDGLMVCERDWEPRHPQDFVRAPPPERLPEWVRPDITSSGDVCTTEGRSAVPGSAIPGCSIPGGTLPGISYPDAPACTPKGRSAVPGYAIPGCSIPGTSYPGISVCTLRGSSAFPGYATPGCAKPSFGF